MFSEIVRNTIEFQQRVFNRNTQFYHDLVRGQSPEICLITCSDSRIDPTLLTGTNPGSLFVVRNPGAVVPGYSNRRDGSVAAIEMAVELLRVPHLVVCGHTQCLGLRGIMFPDEIRHTPSVAEWLKNSGTYPDAEALAEARESSTTPVSAVEQHVLGQMRNLESHASIRRALKNNSLKIHGWVYHLETGAVTGVTRGIREFRDLSELYEV